MRHSPRGAVPAGVQLEKVSLVGSAPTTTKSHCVLHSAVFFQPMVIVPHPHWEVRVWQSPTA